MKNKFMRIAAVMLMLCLVTTCAISGTFAKYTTEAAGKDTARVAYWGWNKDDAKVEISEIFSTTYNSSVSSVNEDKVIAPGTGNVETFKFIYTPNTAESATSPEVAYNFKVDLTGTEAAADIIANGNIKWAVVAGDVALDAIDAGEWGEWDDMVAELNALDGADGTDGKDYAANSALPPIANSIYTIAWMWDFSTDTAGDEADTAMGNKAILDTVTISIKITATQLD